jgi:uncharacterized membrane protein
LRDELAGNLWAIHGGGFYYVEKYKVAPKVIPTHLHWFKYEAYFTWLSGFALTVHRVLRRCAFVHDRSHGRGSFTGASVASASVR